MAGDDGLSSSGGDEPPDAALPEQDLGPVLPDRLDDEAPESGSEWSRAELIDWFEHTYGGFEAFMSRYREIFRYTGGPALGDPMVPVFMPLTSDPVWRIRLDQDLSELHGENGHLKEGVKGLREAAMDYDEILAEHGEYLRAVRDEHLRHHQLEPLTPEQRRNRGPHPDGELYPDERLLEEFEQSVDYPRPPESFEQRLRKGASPEAEQALRRLRVGWEAQYGGVIEGMDITGDVYGVEAGAEPPEEPSVEETTPSPRDRGPGWLEAIPGPARFAGLSALVVLAVVLTVILRSGGDDSSAVVETRPTEPDTDAELPAAGVEPTTAAQPTTTIAPDDGSSARADESDLALTEATAATIPETTTTSTTTTIPLPSDPLSLVTITDATALVDPATGDVFIEACLLGPWVDGPPATGTAFSMIVSVGVIDGDQLHGVQWSVEPGGTRGQSFMAGPTRAATEAEMWVTPDGKLVAKMPGLSPTGGLAAADLGPGATFRLFSQLILAEGDEMQRLDDTPAIGEVVASSEPLPTTLMVRVETDFGPVTLVIPGG